MILFLCVICSVLGLGSVELVSSVCCRKLSCLIGL